MAVRFIFDEKVASVLTAGRRSTANPRGDVSVVWNFSKEFGKEQKGLLGKVASSPRAKMHNGKITRGHAHAMFPDNITPGQSLDLTASSKVMQDALFGSVDATASTPLKVQIIKGNRRRYDIFTLDAVLTDEQKKPENIIGFAEIQLVADTVTVVARTAGKPPVVAATPTTTTAATPAATPAPAAEPTPAPVNETAPANEIPAEVTDTGETSAAVEEAVQEAVQDSTAVASDEIGTGEPIVGEPITEEPVAATEQDGEIGHLAEDRDNPEDTKGQTSAIQSDIVPAVGTTDQADQDQVEEKVA